MRRLTHWWNAQGRVYQHLLTRINYFWWTIRPSKPVRCCWQLQGHRCALRQGNICTRKNLFKRRVKLGFRITRYTVIIYLMCKIACGIGCTYLASILKLKANFSRKLVLTNFCLVSVSLLTSSSPSRLHRCQMYLWASCFSYYCHCFVASSLSAW